MSQLELFIWKNSFRELYKKKYKALLPESCGIYRFYDVENRLLYVGKSKSIKDRIRSYTHIKPTKNSKRLVQLVQGISTVEWEIFRTEKEALLEENEWLRTQKPPFNRANTKPELHLFIGMKQVGEKINLGWTLSEDFHSFDTLFGAFKGMSFTFSFLQALRIVAMYCTENQKLTSELIAKRPPSIFSWNVDSSKEMGLQFLENIFQGECLAIDVIMKNVHLKSSFDEYVFDKQLTILVQWFQQKALLTKKIKQHFGFKNSLVSKDSIDDWVVKLKFDF